MANVILTKLFDVRNGNGVSDGATEYPDATLIAYKDAASKTAILDAFADKFGFVLAVDKPSSSFSTVIFRTTSGRFTESRRLRRQVSQRR